jgi:hypothetical protein
MKIHHFDISEKVNASPELADLPLRLDVERMGAMTPVLATPGVVYAVPVIQVATVEMVTIAGPHRVAPTSRSNHRQER